MKGYWWLELGFWVKKEILGQVWCYLRGFWIEEFKFQVKETCANLGLFEGGGGEDGGLHSSKATAQFGVIIG